MAKTLMVVGLLLQTSAQKVVLIEKQRPEGYEGAGRPKWQVGLLNGLGGVVKEGETPIKTLVRKVEAEAGLKTSDASWKLVNTLMDGDAEIQVFARILTDGEAKKLLSPTDESVGLYYIAKLNSHKTIPNIQWLVPFAWVSLMGEDKQVGITGYNGTDLKKEAATPGIFYAVVNDESKTRLTKVLRDVYDTKDMDNHIAYAGTEAHVDTWMSGWTKEKPYPKYIKQDEPPVDVKASTEKTSGGASKDNAGNAGANTGGSNTGNTGGQATENNAGNTGSGTGSTPGSQTGGTGGGN